MNFSGPCWEGADVTFEQLFEMVGQRVQHRLGGMAPTHRYDPETREPVDALWWLTVEGEVTGWHVDVNAPAWEFVAGGGRVPPVTQAGSAELTIAGYGNVPYHTVVVLDQRPDGGDDVFPDPPMSRWNAVTVGVVAFLAAVALIILVLTIVQAWTT